MKKKIISTIITATLLTTTLLPAISVSANPGLEFDKDTQNKYSEIQSKYNELENKIQGLDDQISLLICKIDSNNQEIDNVNKEIDNTKKEIEQKKEDIAEQEEVLGKRLREIYKSGGQNTYISLIFSAKSLGDLILKIDDTVKLVKLDKKVIKELGDSKDNLDKSVEKLEKKSNETKELNEEIQQQKADLDVKKKEQQDIVEQVKAEKEKFEAENLVPMELQQVDVWLNQVTDNNRTLEEIQYGLSILNGSQCQLRSDVVKAKVADAIAKGNELIRQKRAQQSSPQKQVSASVIDKGSIPSDKAAKLISYAQKFIGVPYVWGGTTPDGFDCSGFTQYVFNNALGIKLGRTTYQQVENGVEIPQSELRPGDLVFPSKDHVAIYIGKNKIIHAPHTGDRVKQADMYACWKAIRVLR